MRQKYFKYPFATAGDVATIPDPTQSDGSISFQSGWPFNYERELGVDSAALPIDRQTMNYLINKVTDQLKQYQENGFPEFISASDNGGTAFSYGYGAVVQYSGHGTPPFSLYVSTTSGNTSVPGTDANWQIMILGYNQIQALIQQLAENYCGSISGTANAIVGVMNPAIISYVSGVGVIFKAGFTNTAAVTFNLGAGAIALKNNAGGDLVAGDIIAGSIYHAVIVDSYFKLIDLVPSQIKALAPINKVIAQVLTSGDIWGGNLRKTGAHQATIDPFSCLDDTGTVQLFKTTSTVITVPTAASSRYHAYFTKAVSDGAITVTLYVSEVLAQADSSMSARRWFDYVDTNGSSVVKEQNTLAGKKYFGLFSEQTINSSSAVPANITTAISLSGYVPDGRVSEILIGAKGEAPGQNIALSGVSGTSWTTIQATNANNGAGDIFEWDTVYTPRFTPIFDGNLYWGRGTLAATCNAQLAIHAAILIR